MSLPTARTRRGAKGVLPVKSTLMDLAVTNIIDEGCEINGSFSVRKSIMFKGSLIGDLTVLKPGNLSLISGTGSIEGCVFAELVIILGEVKGDIHCKDIRFLPGSRFTGSLYYENMRVDPGAVVNARSITIQTYEETGRQKEPSSD